MAHRHVRQFVRKRGARLSGELTAFGPLDLSQELGLDSGRADERLSLVQERSCGGHHRKDTFWTQSRHDSWRRCQSQLGPFMCFWRLIMVQLSFL
jgi:hypothetical protein